MNPHDMIELDQVLEPGGRKPPRSITSTITHNVKGVLILVIGYYLVSYAIAGYNLAYKWGNDRFNEVINEVIEYKLGNFSLAIDSKGKPLDLASMDRGALERQLILISGQYKQCLEAQGEIGAISKSFSERLIDE